MPDFHSSSLFLLGSVYLLGGILYKRIVHQASGMDQLPHADVWYGVWDRVKDMGLILFARCCSGRGRGRRGDRGYMSLPVDEEGGQELRSEEEHFMGREGYEEGQGEYHRGEEGFHQGEEPPVHPSTTRFP